MKFKFPYYKIPVIISKHVFKKGNNFVEYTMINGKNYKISRRQKEILINYRVNDIIDLFFIAALQATQASITLEPTENNERYCNIEIKGVLKAAWFASAIIIGLAITYLLFIEPIIALAFYVGLIFILFVQYKLLEYSTTFISDHIKMDIKEIVNFVEQKTRPST